MFLIRLNILNLISSYVTTYEDVMPCAATFNTINIYESIAVFVILHEGSKDILTDIMYYELS